MADLIYGSSQTDPRYANFQGSLTYAPRSVTTQQPAQTYLSGTVPGFTPSINAPAAPSGGSVLGQSTGTSLLDVFRSMYGPNETMPPGWKPPGDQSDAAQSQSDAELQAALSALDYERGNLEAQQGQLGTQRTNALGELETAFGKSQTQATKSKEEATSATLSAKSKALGTAQDVQRSNRNVLRALGILSSSAAGDMLNRPINEYGKQAADLEQSLVTRKNYIDSWLEERMGEHQTAVKGIEEQYASLVDSIQRDLRFNVQQRTDAVRQAQAALQARIAQIQESAQQYQLTARNFNNQVLQQVAQLQTYQNPQANTGAIQSQLLSSMIPMGSTSQTPGIQQTEEERRRLSGLAR